MFDVFHDGRIRFQFKFVTSAFTSKKQTIYLEGMEGPITTLIILVLTTSPWILGLVQRIRRAFFSSTGLIVLSALLAQVASGEHTIEIHGVLQAANQNPRSGAPYANTMSQSSFVALLSENGWRISVTNSDQPVWWTQRSFDGSNTYVLRPHGGSYWSGTNPPSSDLHIATVVPSANPIPFDADPLGAALVGLTYGLSPESMKSNKIGLVERPIPWTIVRDNPAAWGYKWVFNASDDGRFLRDFSVIRDKALDLPNEQELLRPELDYPDTLGKYNAYMAELLGRKAIPTGHVRARYECSGWYRTNGLAVPRQSKLEVYLPPSNGDLPARAFSLEATRVEIRTGSENLLPEIATRTQVADYRYKRCNENRIFKYAEYTLKSGDPWKDGNDPVLLARAEDWLKHGRKYTDFADRGKSWVTWLVLVLLVSPALAMWLKQSKKETKTQRNK